MNNDNPAVALPAAFAASDAVTPEYLRWLQTVNRREGIGGNMAGWRH